MSLASDNLTLCLNNLLLTATLSSNQTALLPLANLQDPIRLVKTRLNGVSNVQVTLDLTSAQSVQAAIVFDSNLTSAGTVEVRSSTDNFSGSNTLEGTITIGTQPFQLCHPLFLSSVVSRRYWRFVCDDASNPDGYIELGIAYLGAIQQFANNMADPAIEVIDSAQIVRSPAGTPLRSVGPKYRRLTWSLPSLTNAEAWQTFLDLAMDLGISKDFFLSLWPNHATSDIVKRGTLYGAFSQVGRVQSKPTVTRTWSNNQVVFEES